ncbi:MAG: hypothetical protein ABIO16_07600 [Nocardioides sp.]
MRLLIAVAALLLVSACGSDTTDTAEDPGGSAPAMPTAIPPADGPVVGLGLVLDASSGGKPGFCLGPIAESYPPQCTGLAMTGWDWSSHEGAFDNASGVRFGSFVVTGVFDGETLAAQSAVSGAVYDPMKEPQPTSSAAEDHTPAQLEAIAEKLNDLPGALTTMPGENLVVVDVIHDDGSLQDWADASYGAGLVFVHSALRPAG